MIPRARWILDRELRLRQEGRAASRRGKRDLGEVLLMPGLVNTHCHLDYTTLRGRIPRAPNFARWIEALGRAKAPWRAADYREAILEGLREALAFGTTAMLNWICLPEALPAAGAPPMRVWWLWEQIAYRPDAKADRESWDAWRREVRARRALWRGGVAPHAPYTCAREVVRAAARWSARARTPWSLHVAESSDEWRMFREARGALYDFMRRVGRPLSDCDGRTPLAAVWDEIAVSRAPAVLTHANCLDRADVKRLGAAARRGVSLAVAHCPRSTRTLGHPAFPLRALRQAGVPVALGTDSLASNDDLSMFAEMRAFADAHPARHPREIVAMATLDAAKALGAGAAWKRWKDWIAIPCSATRPSGVWDVLLAHQGPVAWAMVDGREVDLETLKRRAPCAAPEPAA
ncbi:MAG: amidohydrolase family protein [Verrucomicrobiae bacterium]|nr:amidohydrolase family protein [Verrucomicrobiae bacterium]